MMWRGDYLHRLKQKINQVKRPSCVIRTLKSPAIHVSHTHLTATSHKFPKALFMFHSVILKYWSFIFWRASVLFGYGIYNDLICFLILHNFIHLSSLTLSVLWFLPFVYFICVLSLIYKCFHFPLKLTLRLFWKVQISKFTLLPYHGWWHFRQS